MSENAAIRKNATEVNELFGEDSGEGWRNKLLALILRFTFYLGILVYLPSLYMCYVGRYVDIAIIDTVVIVGIFLLYRGESWPFRTRAVGFSLLFYALGTVLLISLGPISQIYLFGFSIFAGLLLGTRFGLACVALNCVTLLVAGLTGAASPTMAAVWDQNPKSWFVIVVNFVFMNALMVIANGAIIAALERALSRQRQALARAENVARVLRETNDQLEREVEERRRTEEALAFSVERFRLHSRATTDAIWDWDPATGTMWWNEGYESLFGYRGDDADSNVDAWKARIHPDDLPRVMKSVQRALDGNAEQWQAEYRYRRADGGYASVLDRGHIIRDENGTATRMVGGMADLTERKQLEQHLLRTQRMESIGTLAGGIAHDLNNVLAPILMATDMLRESVLDPEGRSILAMIRTSGQRAADLVRQVLTFARGIEGVRKPVDVRDIVREIHEVTRDTFPKNIAFRLQLPPQVDPVIADPTQLQQVLMNLCVNARDAMPEGGELTVAVENITLDEHSLIQGVPLPMGPYVVIVVEDSGTGIPPEIQDKIFEPFFTTKDVGSGTGLGLSTTFTIVRDHGGAISVHSELSRGTQFLIYLPAAPSGLETTSGHARRLPPRGNGETVLLVDDEPAIRDVAGRALEFFGYRVIHASNGAEALAVYHADAGSVDVVMTDVSMPIMDGPAMAEALRRIDPEIPIIASSGLATGSALMPIQGPEIRMIAKPYAIDELLQAVHDVLKERLRRSTPPPP